MIRPRGTARAGRWPAHDQIVDVGPTSIPTITNTSMAMQIKQIKRIQAWIGCCPVHSRSCPGTIRPYPPALPRLVSARRDHVAARAGRWHCVRGPDFKIGELLTAVDPQN